MVFLFPIIYSQIKKVAELVENIDSESYELVPAEIIMLEPVGSGDRVVSTSFYNECWRGHVSRFLSKGLFLVHSESMESEYVASRPFRVNAGPVHAYVMTPGNKTRYHLK